MKLKDELTFCGLLLVCAARALAAIVAVFLPSRRRR